VPNPPFLTQLQLAKAQAEVEGFQMGPEPALNPANLNTQELIGNPNAIPNAPASIPYYPPLQLTPNLQLALFDMSTEVAQNFVILDNAVPVAVNDDIMHNVTGKGFSFQPLISGVYNIVLVATSINPPGPYAPAQVNFDVAYTDNAGPEYNDAVVSITDNNEPASINEAIFALSTAPITIFSSYVTFGVAGALPANAWWLPVTLGGSGTAAYGATLHQATSGATAKYYGVVALGGVPGNMIYTVLTGVDGSNTGYVWADPISGQTFTPGGSTTAGTFTGPGFGVPMTQFVTGAYGQEMDPASGPVGVMHIGPHVSGVADIPSGYIDIPGTAPSLTTNYAWYDPVNGGVWQPTATWTDAATLIVFPYNFHIRVTQLG
jgi:hypothetical protein